MVRHPIALGATALASALLTAGCGGGGTSTTASTGSSAAAGASTQSATTPAAATAPTDTSSTSTPARAALVSTKHNKLGTVLAAGSKQLTVYLFEADKGPASTCTGACARVWPPLTTSGAPKAGGGAHAADLGTTTRPDGSTQVTYKGHPLYYYDKDKDNGDSYGQGVKSFGAGWYVLAPAGHKIDHS